MNLTLPSCAQIHLRPLKHSLIKSVSPGSLFGHAECMRSRYNETQKETEMGSEKEDKVSQCILIPKEMEFLQQPLWHTW